MVKIGLLHTTIRSEEKLLAAAAIKAGVLVDLIDVRSLILSKNETFSHDIYLERCISTVKGMYVVQFLESIDKNVVNSSKVALVCQDKYITSLNLLRNGIQTPEFFMCFDVKEAKKGIESMGGYPVVLKPAQGSWGRLLAKVNDVDCLEAIIEHKSVLGTPPHGAFYIQKYIEKKGRDIRAFVIDGTIICAIARKSEHWITNTARGGSVDVYKITTQLQRICKKTSDAVGGGILAIDLMETNDGYTVNEVNHTMEFKNSEIPTGVSISGAIIDYCISKIENNKT